MTVFVLNKNKKPLMPCTEHRAKKLMESGRAVVHKCFPFTLRIKTCIDAEAPALRLKICQGAKRTGMAVLNGNKVIFLVEIGHKNPHMNIHSRASLRRGRRHRKTRYRPARFKNRRKPKGWLPPSLSCRVDQIMHAVKKIRDSLPIAELSVQTAKFDTQKMHNSEISGVEYQQGKLGGYEVREYLLEKWGRKCVYCGKKDVELGIDHIVPKARGGSNSVENLTIACKTCNRKKGRKTAAEFGHPEVLAKAKKPLKEAAFMNAIRSRAYMRLLDVFLPQRIEVGTGAMTKMNRITAGLPKLKCLDACCVGESTPEKLDFTGVNYYQTWDYVGRGNRQICQPINKDGYPVRHRSRKKSVDGIQTGDFVLGMKKNGDKMTGRVNIRASGNFYIPVKGGKRFTFTRRNTRLIQHGDGWRYGKKKLPEGVQPGNRRRQHHICIENEGGTPPRFTPL